ncbi:hypothetical protein GCM10010485_43550 [Streptosporangium carneum]
MVFGTSRGRVRAATGLTGMSTSGTPVVVRGSPAFRETGPSRTPGRGGGRGGRAVADTGGAVEATSAVASDTVKASTGGAARAPRARATTKSAKSSSGGGA